MANSSSKDLVKKQLFFLYKYCHLHKIKVTLYKTGKTIIFTAGHFAKYINSY